MTPNKNRHIVAAAPQDLWGQEKYVQENPISSDLDSLVNNDTLDPVTLTEIDSVENDGSTNTQNSGEVIL